MLQQAMQLGGCRKKRKKFEKERTISIFTRTERANGLDDA